MRHARFIVIRRLAGVRGTYEMIEVPKRLIARCFGFVDGYFQMDPGSAEKSELWRDLNREITRPRATPEPQPASSNRLCDLLRFRILTRENSGEEAIAKLRLMAADEIELLEQRLKVAHDCLRKGLSTAHEPCAVIDLDAEMWRSVKQAIQSAPRFQEMYQAGGCLTDAVNDVESWLAQPPDILSKVDGLLQSMIVSAEVFTDTESTVTGYKIKTGALHKIAGLRGLFFPQNMKEATVSDELERYKQALYRANGFLILHGLEPVKLEYSTPTKGAAS